MRLCDVVYTLEVAPFDKVNSCMTPYIRYGHSALKFNTHSRNITAHCAELETGLSLEEFSMSF